MTETQARVRDVSEEALETAPVHETGFDGVTVIRPLFPSKGVPYPIFVYSALLPWTYFASSVALSS